MLRGLVSVSLSCCSSLWDGLSYRLPTEEEKWGLLVRWEKHDTRGVVSSVSLSGALSVQHIWVHHPPMPPLLPSLCLVSNCLLFLCFVFLWLWWLNFLLAGSKRRRTTLLRLTRPETLAKNTTAPAWAQLLSPHAVYNSSAQSSWRCPSGWAPGSALFALAFLLPGRAWTACAALRSV